MAEAQQQQQQTHKAEWVNDVVLPVGRAGYVHLKTPDAYEGKGEPKYKYRHIFPKDLDFVDFKKKTLLCARKKWGKNIKLKDINVPWQDGDEQADKDGHADSYYLNLKSSKKVTVINRKKEDIEPDDIYAGCQVRGVVSLYTYAGFDLEVHIVKDPDTGKSVKKKVKVPYKGVTCKLEVVQFLRDDESFGKGGSGAKRNILDDLEDDEMDAGDVILDDDDMMLEENIDDVDLGDDPVEEVGEDNLDDIDVSDLD